MSLTEWPVRNLRIAVLVHMLVGVHLASKNKNVQDADKMALQSTLV
jgi:hypothetical protein